MFFLLSALLVLLFPQNLWAVHYQRRISTTHLVCKHGYTLIHGYCWMIHTEQYNHYHASTVCRDQAATLAVYENPEVNEAIVLSAKNHTNLWVGLKCDSIEECRTITNSSKFFYGGAPIPSIGRCTMMMTAGTLAGKWISVQCNKNMAFVCGYVPEECLCPRVPSIRRESGFIRAAFPANCPEMQCQYNVLYPDEIGGNVSSQGGFTTPKYLKIEVAAEFNQRELLKITWDDEYAGFQTGSSSLAVLAASNVTIVYRRGETTRPRINESSYEISYKWVYNTDCSCGREDLVAVSEAWREIYSPQFPEGNSCHLECRSSFHVPDGHHLLVNISFLGVKSNCFLLNLYDGYNQTGKILRKLEGASVSMQMIRLPGQNVTIEQTYRSTCDRNLRQGGYVLAYTAEKDVEGRGFFKDIYDFMSGVFYKEPKKQGLLFSIFKGSSTTRSVKFKQTVQTTNKPKGHCDVLNMECREERSTLTTAIIIIVIIISLTIFCTSYSRMRKRCTKRNEQRRRQDYEVESPVDGMALLPPTPIPNRDPARRPYDAKI